MYWRLVSRIAIFVLLVGIIAGAIPAQAAVDSTFLTTTPSGPPDAQPHTDGSTVVWQVHQSQVAESPRDVYAAKLTDRQVFPVATGPTDQGDPDIDGGIVVWADGARDPETGLGVYTIRGRDLATGRELEIGSAMGESPRPAISGKWVVWRSQTGDAWSILARDISTMSEPFTLMRRTGGFVAIQPPSIDGDQMVWLESVERTVDGKAIWDWQFVTCPVADCTATVVSETKDSPFVPTSYDAGGDFVVFDSFTPFHSVTAVDLRTHASRVLPGNGFRPTTDGRYVFWESWQTSKIVDLQGYDLQTESTFPVSASTGFNRRPSTSHGMLVWQRGTGSVEIHSAPIASMLPSARQPDPGTTSPDWLYFSETGHYLSAGFQQFWERSGGLPVFGFPLTEEFSEQGLTVQYLERQRFEYHPEHAGTPYETELGLLGTEDANRRGLPGNAAFQPLPGGTSSDGNCTFVPETGHKLCGMFRSYWRSHGLEFDDPGISYRESLALFGYPISEEFTDPETGLVTQYFERARFEYHPENPVPSQVLLGRLGADMIAQRGW